MAELVLGTSDFSESMYLIKEFMGDRPLYWLLLIVCNIPVYIGLMYLVFQTREAFREACWYIFQPDCWSLIKGEFLADITATCKVALWVVLCIAAVVSEHFLFFR